MNIIEWCNENNGFIMAMLTFVYVAATIVICWLNKKAAEAAQRQITEAEEMQKITLKIQEQNVAIQLFEKRYEVYSLLAKWIQNVEQILAFDVTIFSDNTRLICALYLFEDVVFVDVDHAELVELQGKINMLGPEITSETRKKMAVLRDAKIKKATSIITKDGSIIRSAHFYFKNINLESLDDFVSKYILLCNKLIKKGNVEDAKAVAKKLCDCMDKVNKSSVLQKMENELNIVSERYSDDKSPKKINYTS